MKAWRREFTGKHRGKKEEFCLRAVESAGEIKGQLVLYAALMEVMKGKMPPNLPDTSAEARVLVFNAVCNLGFSIKYFFCPTIFDLTSSPGLERDICQHIQLQQFIPSVKPCCHQWDGRVLSAGPSLLSWAFQCCTISTQSSLDALDTGRGLHLEVRSGQHLVFP